VNTQTLGYLLKAAIGMHAGEVIPWRPVRKSDPPPPPPPVQQPLRPAAVRKADTLGDYLVELLLTKPQAQEQSAQAAAGRVAAADERIRDLEARIAQIEAERSTHH